MTVNIPTIPKMTKLQAATQAALRAQRLRPLVDRMALQLSDTKNAPAAVVKLGEDAQRLKSIYAAWLQKVAGMDNWVNDLALIPSNIEEAGFVLLQEQLAMEQGFLSICTAYQKAAGRNVEGCSAGQFPPLIAPNEPDSGPWSALSKAAVAIAASTVIYAGVRVVKSLTSKAS